jgi:type III secretion system FlhB-like substrate exporter
LSSIELEDEIPERLYEAVAEILAFVLSAARE